MLQHHPVLLFIFILILILQQLKIECRPTAQKHLINGHEWTISDEPGWAEGKLVFKICLGTKQH
jgi:hypothetical protein